MTHDSLIESLAGHLLAPDRMVWRDMQIGPSGSPRPDVFTLFKSFAHPQPIAYECKVSRSDFRSDVTSGKWQSYLRYASGVYFAVEAGLIDKREVPDQCGLIVLKDDKWRSAKKPVLNAGWEIPRSAWLKLVIDGVERQGANAIRRRAISEWTDSQRINARFGELAAKTIFDRARVEGEIAAAKRHAERIESEARSAAERIRKDAREDAEAIPQFKRDLCDVLGLPPESDRYALTRAIGKIREAHRRHPVASQFENLTAHVRRALDVYGYKPVECDDEATDAATSTGCRTR